MEESKLDKSKEFKEEQSENIWDIFLTDNWEISGNIKEFNILHPLNI